MSACGAQSLQLQSARDSYVSFLQVENPSVIWILTKHVATSPECLTRMEPTNLALSLSDQPDETLRHRLGLRLNAKSFGALLARAQAQGVRVSGMSCRVQTLGRAS